VLVSDLDDNPNDLPALAATGAVAQHNRVPVRIVGLNPSPADIEYFSTVFGHSAPIVEAPTLGQTALPERTSFPWGLVALALTAAIAVALREAWAPILGWRRSP
jgi:hypothetical protein